MKKPGRPIWLFPLIAASPALLLAVLVVLFTRDLLALRAVDPAAIHRDLAERFPSKSFFLEPLPEKVHTLDRTKKQVFVFGSSTLLLSDGGVFPDYLEQQDPRLQVVNFGESGIESLSLKERVRAALKVARPDVMLVVIGDNDFNSAYQGYIIPTYFNKFGWLLRFPYLFYNNTKSISQFAPGEFYWYERLNRSRLLKLCQQLGLLRVDSREYQAINQLIVAYCLQNLQEITALAGAQGVPVVIITPVGNLHAEPYGDLSTTELYQKGLTAGDYGQALDYLKRARDSELFTYDLRAKSEMLAALRSLQGANVHLLDLEKILEARHFEFSGANFLDYVHFNDHSHRLLAEIIGGYLARNQLLR